MRKQCAVNSCGDEAAAAALRLPHKSRTRYHSFADSVVCSGLWKRQRNREKKMNVYNLNVRCCITLFFFDCDAFLCFRRACNNITLPPSGFFILLFWNGRRESNLPLHRATLFARGIFNLFLLIS